MNRCGMMEGREFYCSLTDNDTPVAVNFHRRTILSPLRFFDLNNGSYLANLTES